MSCFYITFDDNRQMVVLDNMLLPIDGGMKEVKQLQVGDKVVIAGNKQVAIKYIEASTPLMCNLNLTEDVRAKLRDLVGEIKMPEKGGEGICYVCYFANGVVFMTDGETEIETLEKEKIKVKRLRQGDRIKCGMEITNIIDVGLALYMERLSRLNIQEQGKEIIHRGDGSILMMEPGWIDHREINWNLLFPIGKNGIKDPRCGMILGIYTMGIAENWNKLQEQLKEIEEKLIKNQEMR